MSKRKPLSLNFFLEKAKAEQEHISNAPKTVITVVKTLLNKYLEAGTLEVDDILKSIKTGTSEAGYWTIILEDDIYLQKGNLSLEEIAWLVGYRSYSGFQLCFKRHFGKTPSQFRKEKTG